jgi:hypothetical protein
VFFVQLYRPVDFDIFNFFIHSSSAFFCGALFYYDFFNGRDVGVVAMFLVSVIFSLGKSILSSYSKKLSNAT